jgi:alkaline phosphatase D
MNKAGLYIRNSDMKTVSPKEKFRLTRRKWLLGSSAAAAVAVSAPFVARFAHASPDIAKGETIFGLGIASGDPWSDSIVLWTRLAPKPVEENGGMPDKPFEVTWEIAADERMTQTVQKGTAVADPNMGHCVHVDVRGLNPARDYWYRFRIGNQQSAIGHTRTAPAPGTAVDQVKFAFSSCQKYEEGHYTAHKHMAGEDLDFVLFLGDYIYEKPAKLGKPREHDLDLCESVAQYRQRYGLYKSDVNLQACHAAHPWINTWDDHEFANDYANDYDTPNAEKSPEFLQRRANAYKVFYEHMPMRKTQMPRGPHLQLYRRFVFGDLVLLNVLDTRQYRTPQPCGNKTKPLCDEVYDPKATMLGAQQERWLFDGLTASKARWNALGQQVPMMQRLNPKRGTDRYNLDKWDGYRVSRSRLINFLDKQNISNPVVLSGDIHEHHVGDLKLNFDDPTSKTVGSEFVTTSISSKGNGRNMTKKGKRYLKYNDHFKFFNQKRGYNLTTVTRNEWRSDLKTLKRVTEPDMPIKTKASFAINAGKPGVEEI